MTGNDSNIDPRVKRAKRQLWIGLVIIVVLGLLFAWYFVFVDTVQAPTTEDETAVTSDVSGDIYLTGTTPASSSTVEELRQVSISFSQPIDGSTVTDDNFYVLQGIGEHMPGSLTVSDDTTTITFTAATPATVTDQVQAYTVVVDPTDMRGAEGQSIHIPGDTAEWNIYVASEPYVGP